MNSTGLLLCGLKENGPSRPKRPTAGPLARPKGRRDSRGAGLQPKRPRGAARGRSERGGSGAAARARRRGRNGDSGDGQGGTGRTARGGAAQVGLKNPRVLRVCGLGFSRVRVLGCGSGGAGIDPAVP